MLLLRHADTAEHLIEAVDRECISAPRIGTIRVHDAFVLCQPVKHRARFFDLFIIRGKGEQIDKPAPMLPTAKHGDQTAKPLCHRQRDRRLDAGTHDDRTGKPLPVHRNILPREERAHAVSEQKIWDIRIFLLRQAPKRVDVGEQTFVAVRMLEIAVLFVFRHRFAVSEMIVSDDVDACRVHRRREAVVAQNMLRHSVADLQNGADFSVGDPFDDANRRFSVRRRKCEGLFHVGTILSFYFYNSIILPFKRKSSPVLFWRNTKNALLSTDESAFFAPKKRSEDTAKQAFLIELFYRMVLACYIHNTYPYIFQFLIQILRKKPSASDC